MLSPCCSHIPFKRTYSSVFGKECLVFGKEYVAPFQVYLSQSVPKWLSCQYSVSKSYAKPIIQANNVQGLSCQYSVSQSCTTAVMSVFCQPIKDQFCLLLYIISNCWVSARSAVLSGVFCASSLRGPLYFTEQQA